MDKDVEILLNEVRHLHRERMKDLFHELMMLGNEPHSHWRGKTTYKVELTFSAWCALEKRYLGDDEKPSNA